MKGTKPREDHEVENLTKKDLESEMQKDPNVQKIAEATGSTIRTPEEFGSDPEVLRNKAARLAFEKKQKRKRIGIIVGVLAIVAVIAIGTVVALSGGGDGEGDGEGGDGEDGGNGVVTTAPTDSPTAGPFRITDVEDQERLCEAIFKSEQFDIEKDNDQLVFAVCQPDEGKSFFSCSGDGKGQQNIGTCSVVLKKLCPCEPGLVINVTSFDNFGQVCVDEADNNVNNPVCVELEGDLAGLLAATDAPTNTPTKTPTTSPTVTQQDS